MSSYPPQHAQQPQYPQQPQPQYPQQPNFRPTVSDKNPAIAALLSFFVPGLGNIYAGRVLGGILWFIGLFVMWGFFWSVMIKIGDGTGDVSWEALVIFMPPAFHIAAAVAAFLAARAFNRRNAIIVR